jgi:hypothetical protein
MVLSGMPLMGCLSTPDPAEEQWGSNHLAIDEWVIINAAHAKVHGAKSGYCDGAGNCANYDTNVDYIKTNKGGVDNVNNIFVIVQGAGACGDCNSCKSGAGYTDRHNGAHPYIDPLFWYGDGTTGNDTNVGKTVLTGTSFDIPVITDSNSPFNTGYSYAFFPQVTGDAHAGNHKAHYDTSTAPPGFTCQNTVNIGHYGYTNFNAYLATLKDAFPNLANPTVATTIVLWGLSSGGLGVLCNAQQIKNAFNNPNIKLYLMDDGGVTITGHDNVENLAPRVSLWMDSNHWGAQCPTGGDLGDGGTLGPEDTERYNRINLASSSMRFASRQSTNDFVMSFFAWYLGGVDDGTGNSPYAVKHSLSFDLTRDKSLLGDITTGNANDKGFFGSPDMHTIGDNKDQSPPQFETYSEGGVNFLNFVRGWMGISGYSSYYTTVEWSGYPN